MRMTDARELELNMIFFIKKVIEKEIGRTDFTYLTENPDDDVELNTSFKNPNNIESDPAVKNSKKLPIIVLDIDGFDSESFEMGNSFEEVARFSIDVMCNKKADSRDIAEIISRALNGTHDMMDFESLGRNIPKITDAYDDSKMPTATLNPWSIDGSELPRVCFKNDGGETSNGNFIKRWQCSMFGTVSYLRNY